MKKKCTSCGLCCKLFLINLNEEEYKSNCFKTVFKDIVEFQDFNQAKTLGANILSQKEDGSCVYLKRKLCSIHKKRPTVCQKFFCTSKSKKFEGMVKIIYRNK